MNSQENSQMDDAQVGGATDASDIAETKPVLGLSSYEQSGPESPDIQEIHRAVLREQFEPSEGQQRVPIFLFLLFIGLAMWAGWYLSEFDGNFQANVYDGPDAFRLMDLSQAGVKTEKTIDPILLGKRVYNNCVACHQAGGEGVAGQYPPLNKSEWVVGDDKILARILLHGLTGPVQVRGKLYNAQMPAWRQLSDRDIAAVLSYIRQAWDNKAPAVSEETISTLRTSLGERGPWTSETLQSLALPDTTTQANPTSSTTVADIATGSETSEPNKNSVGNNGTEASVPNQGKKP